MTFDKTCHIFSSAIISDGIDVDDIDIHICGRYINKFVVHAST